MTARALAICVFAPVPPPTHGSTLAVRLLLDSGLTQVARVTHINASYASSLANQGIPELRKLGLMVRYLMALRRAERRGHFDYVVLTPAFTLWPCMKDMLCILGASVVTRARIIVWSHSDNALRFYESAPAPVQALMRQALRRVAHVVVAGESLKYNFVPFVGESRITTIPNGLPPRTVRPTRGAHDRVRLIYLSNMLREKGWPELLEAAESACRTRPALEVTFYGAATADSPAGEVTRAFAATSVPDRIRWAGPVSGDAKWAALDGADVMCLPSHREAQPIAVLEAMQAGAAVVASPVGAIPEMVVEGKGGLLVPPRDVAALAHAIGRLADDASLRLRMGAFNRDRFRERFEMQGVAARWISFFDTLEGRSG
jgi:glycosyltransferase involved in cell wall biosynthesis